MILNPYQSASPSSPSESSESSSTALPRTPLVSKSPFPPTSPLPSPPFPQRRSLTHPKVPLQVLQSRGVLLTCLAQLGSMAARWTILYYAPIFILAVRGLSP